VTELVELRRHYQEILGRHVDVIAVSVDPPDVSARLRERLGLGIRFLSDERGILIDALQIRDRNAMPPPPFGRPVREGDSRDLFMATTFLLDEQGVIRWVYRPETYRVRAPARDVLRAIDALG
jgi:peroxiredoxin